jgi:hypothetical protein
LISGEMAGTTVFVGNPSRLRPGQAALCFLGDRFTVFRDLSGIGKPRLRQDEPTTCSFILYNISPSNQSTSGTNRGQMAITAEITPCYVGTNSGH